MAEGRFGEQSKSEKRDEAGDSTPLRPPTEDPPVDALSYGVSRQESRAVMVGGGFMILDEEPVTFAPYERAGHVCTLDCPSPWRSDVRARGIGEAIRALLHDGIPRGASTVAAELGITPWAEPGYAYESVMRACGYMVSDGRLVATPTEGESEHMLTLPEAS